MRHDNSNVDFTKKSKHKITDRQIKTLNRKIKDNVIDPTRPPSRHVCFVYNNYNIDEIDNIINTLQKCCKYGVIGKEIGDSGTHHLQGYVEFKDVKTISAMKKLHNSIHWEYKYKNSTILRCSNYCKKGEQSHTEWDDLHEDGPNFGINADFQEFGTISNPNGKRKDLENTIKAITSGEIKDVKDLSISNPELFHTYGRTLLTAELQILRKRSRWNEKLMTLGEWYFGPTGVGKSLEARLRCEERNESLYTWNADDKGWHELYRQQDCVIIDDFRGGEFTYNYLMKLVDIYDFTISIRNFGPIPFVSKKVYITSSLPPEKIFTNRKKEDSIKQFIRRFKTFTRNNINDPWIPYEIPENADDVLHGHGGSCER